MCKLWMCATCVRWTIKPMSTVDTHTQIDKRRWTFELNHIKLIELNFVLECSRVVCSFGRQQWFWLHTSDEHTILSSCRRQRQILLRFISLSFWYLDIIIVLSTRFGSQYAFVCQVFRWDCGPHRTTHREHGVEEKKIRRHRKCNKRKAMRWHYLTWTIKSNIVFQMSVAWP